MHDTIAEATAAILKDCPFCGSENVTVSTVEQDYQVAYAVWCSECEAVGPTAATPHESAGKWDSRVEPVA